MTTGERRFASRLGWGLALAMLACGAPATARAPDVPRSEAPPSAKPPSDAGDDRPTTASYRLPERGQFDAWLSQGHAADFSAFEALLRAEGVADVLPAWTLWYQGTDWRALGAEPFTVPPREDWPRAVPTLRLIRDGVVPIVGPVQVVSGYRTLAYNERAGGAKRSAHLRFGAFDLVPERPWERQALIDDLLRLHARVGRAHAFGLGIYSGVRFHVDTASMRYWPKPELSERSKALGL